MDNDFQKNFIDFASKLGQKIDENRCDLISLLCKYESYETAQYEIEHSIITLKGFSKEFLDLDFSKQYYAISTFFPINLPLYSLVLFAIAPAAFTRKVYVRPPFAVFELLKEIASYIDLKSFFPNIELKPVTRREFLEECVSDSQVVIFNGRYENVQELIRQFPKKVFIYNGRGINPAVIGPRADIGLAVKKVVEMRIFNSGQDCAGIDAIFVDGGIYNKFIYALKKEILQISVGDYNEPQVRIGKIQRSEYINELEKFLSKASDSITVNGKIDKEKGIVHPHIIERDIKQHAGHFDEFFGPIFYVLRYERNSDLIDLLNTEYYADYAMYVSVFGADKRVVEKIPNTCVLVNKVVNDIEIGNKPYGGYGSKANFVYKNNSCEIRPILISQELAF